MKTSEQAALRLISRALTITAAAQLAFGGYLIVNGILKATAAP